MRTTAGGEAYVKRLVETVAIPVFQFGMFSSVDLSFSAAEDFDFGGRVHTNGNLFLAQGGGSTSTLTMRDKVTAVGEIVRQRLSNGASIDTSGSTRTVRVATAANSFRTLLRTEGSVVDGMPSAANTAWPTLSLSTYNGYLRTGRTGAKILNLPLMNLGDQNINVVNRNIDIIRRPPPGEDATNHALLNERFFTKVSLRILLSDRQQDILSLPGVTQTPLPVSLDDNWTSTPGYAPIGPRLPVAQSPGLVTFAISGNAAANTNDVAAGTNQTMRVDNVPAYFLMTPFTVTSGLGVSYTATCTGKTTTSFLGCTFTNLPGGANTAAGTAITGPITFRTVVDGLPVQTTRAATWNYAVGGNITNVVNTLGFAHNTFVVNDAPGVVTCGGYTTVGNDVFTECNVPVTIDTTPAAPASTGARSNAGTSLTGGFLKIERQDPSGVWHDVTLEILNYGIGSGNLGGRLCADPTPNAIIRLQRLRDNNEVGAWPLEAGTTCGYQGSVNPRDYWPNTLFDAREALYRDANPNAAGDTSVRLGGVMHYVALDARNLSRWFRADANSPFGASTGPVSMQDNGFSVYFSDRRNNRNLNNQETGEYGFEDVVNPSNAQGTPSTTLNPGEDMNGNGYLENYGQFPSYLGANTTVPPCAACPGLPAAQQTLTVNHRPWQNVGGGVAKSNRAILFRRALKLVNGGLGNIVAPGLTIASENPIYLQGDWNASQLGFVEPNVATSILADSVTLLSNAWDDNNSFLSPYATVGRPRTRSFYRVAIIAGKGPIFPRPGNGEGATFGTDGGVHSFLRFLEGTGNSQANDTVSYRGSMATFFYHRQAISPFKCCNQIVYDVPTRAFAFDVDFLDPALLPPLTPVFRDTNALGFAQEVRPGF